MRTFGRPGVNESAGFTTCPESERQKSDGFFLVPLHVFLSTGGVLELGDNGASKALARKGVGVRIPSPPPFTFLDRIVARPVPWCLAWGCSSVGRAQGWQSWGQGFESPQLHQIITLRDTTASPPGRPAAAGPAPRSGSCRAPGRSRGRRSRALAWPSARPPSP